MKKYGDHREYLLVLDYSDKINKDFVKCEFNEHNFTTFACIHLIQDNDEVD